MLFVGEVRDRLTLVSLDESEYFDAIKRSAQRGFNSGRVYGLQRRPELGSRRAAFRLRIGWFSASRRDSALAQS